MSDQSHSTDRTPSELLATPVQFVKGVGPQKAELLAKLNLRFARDLVFFFPRDYQDLSELRAIPDLEEGEAFSVFGKIAEVELRNIGVGRTMLGVLIEHEGSHLRGVWFNQPYMQQKFERDQSVLFSGSVKNNGGRWEMVHPQIEFLESGQPPPTGRVLPIYPLTEGLNQSQMRRMIGGVVESHSPLIPEVFPPDYLDEHNLWPIQAALPQLHQPATLETLEQARRRFIYQELLVLQLSLAMRRWLLTHNRQAPPLEADARLDARIRRLFPFELTNDQNRVIKEIVADMSRPIPMNRLLQGDVGSGKTVVAIYAMLTAVANGHQAALMTPTEVLARQHFATLSSQLSASKVGCELITGSLTSAQKRDAVKRIESGEVDLVVGTQAIANLMQKENSPLAGVGLVIIDEQHKFGVRQRAALKSGDLDPHYLVMTATPIPRTVSMTMFGDLDVSSLRDKPPGRQTVHTYIGDDSKRAKWYEFFRKKLKEGRQGFVVTPLVEDTEAFSLSSVEQAFEELSNGELADFRLDLIHGRMSGEEKAAAMEKFRDHRTDVLAATSVIEVGIDIPNATLMTIENGERFGLAQLHQLRGRICRGAHPGFLTVFTDSQSEDAMQRLEAFAGVEDGFELAEVDFQLRGPGDLFGSKQHGLPPLRIADFQRDEAVLQEARRDAQAIIARDPQLADPQWALLKKMVEVRYAEALDIVDAG